MDLISADPLKEVGRHAGALVVGVADARAFNEFVPSGHRPEDVLPGARSVVVVRQRDRSFDSS